MKLAQERFNTIKADIWRRYRDLYDKDSLDTDIKNGMRVYVRRPPFSSQNHGSCTRFICCFEGPYIVVSDVHGRPDLLQLHNEINNTGLSTVNIEKLVVVPSGDPHDVCEQDPLPTKASVLPYAGNDQELAMVCYEIAKYLFQKPNNTAPVSETCKYIYNLLPYARDLIAKCGKLDGIVQRCSYLHLVKGISTRNLNLKFVHSS